MKGIKPREQDLDGVKFFLICLVVIGHAIEPIRYTNTIAECIYSLIYLFHMPLFILLSGYFTNPNSDIEKINKQCVMLLDSYFLISFFIFLFVERRLSVFFAPPLSSWYLLSLICWRYAYYYYRIFAKRKFSFITMCAGDKNFFLCFVSIIIAIMMFLLPMNKTSKILAIGRTCQFFPFFVIGIILRYHGLNRIKKLPIQIALGFSIIALICFLSFMQPRLLHLVCFHRSDFFTISVDTGALGNTVLLYKMFVELSAFMICLFVLSVSRIFNKIGEYGKSTMTIFVLQAILVHYLALRLPHNIYVELSLTAVVIYCGIFISRSKYNKFITNPIITLYNHQNKK